MNNAYEIKVGAPLLRPGLTITTVVSRGYLEDAVTVLMDAVREINHSTPPNMGHAMGNVTQGLAVQMTEHEVARVIRNQDAARRETPEPSVEIQSGTTVSVHS